MNKQWWIGLVMAASAAAVQSAGASATEVAAGCKAAGDEPLAIYLVRHAEKRSDAADPQLSSSGVERAQHLARVLGAQALDGVFTTDYRRTRDTAAAVANAQQLPLAYYNPAALADFASALCARHGRWLVVGHSNTTPELVTLLGGEAGAPIVEVSEYDRLYLLVRSGAGVMTFIQRYGADSGTGAAPNAR